MKKIDNKLLMAFTNKAVNRLSGDWIIIGGSVLQLLNIDVRVTTDIDIAGPDSATQKDTLTLMDIATEIGLPVEAINQAASYFLYKIPVWQSSLVLVQAGKLGRILRPNTDLFIKLKLARLTPSDLDDCLAMLHYAKQQKEQIDAKSLQKLIKTMMKTETNGEKKHRMQLLFAELSL